MLIIDKQKISVNCDWFSFSAKSNCHYEEIELQCPIGFNIEILKGTKQYRQRFIVTDNVGIKMMTILMFPIIKFIDEDLMLVEIGNQYLYNDALKLCWVVLQAIVPCTYNNPSRVDICCDINPTYRQRKIIRGLFRKNYYVAQKNDWSQWGQKEDGHQLTWGSKKSQFKWKLYNKSKELKVTEEIREYDKPYIVDEWKKCGMDIYNVWRLEISMTDVSKIELFGNKIMFEDIIDQATITMIFFEMLDRRFVIRRKEGHTRKSNDTEVKLIDIRVERAKTATRKPQIERQKYAGVQEFFAIKRMLDKSTIATTDEKFVQRMVAAASRVAIDYGLNPYFERVYKCKADDMLLPILERLKVDVYTEYNNEVEHNYMDLKPNENFDAG